MKTISWVVVLLAGLSVVHSRPKEEARPYYETNAKVSEDGDPIWGGDVVVSEEEMASQMRGVDLRTAHINRNILWPQGNIPFKISPEMERVRENIFKGLAMWNDETCVHFYEDAAISSDPYVVLKNTGKGCKSMVGKPPRRYNVILGDECHEVPTIVHELGHVLGLWHEQDRPDRDSYLTLFTKNMKPENRVHFNNRMSYVDTYGLPYDYSSIMQYSANAFSNNGLMTMVPKDPFAIAVMGNAKKPSFRDYKLVNLMYNCTNRCSHVSCSNGGYAAWNSKKNCRCMCPPGFSGASCATKVAKEPTCTYTITSPSTISSPNYPNVMPARTYCAWLIKAPANKKIQVKFNTFQLLWRAKNKNCAWDSLIVREYDFRSDDLGTMYCDEELKEKSLFGEKQMFLELKTGQYDDYAHGFEATVSFV